MSEHEHDPTEDIVTQETGNVFPEAHQWVQDGAEANPGIVFQAIVDGQLITSEISPGIRELWCDEMPPVWELGLHD